MLPLVKHHIVILRNSTLIKARESKQMDSQESPSKGVSVEGWIINPYEYGLLDGPGKIV